MINIVKRGRGRPKQNIHRDIQFNLRMHMGEEAMLKRLSEKMGISKSAVLLTALKKMYRETYFD